MLIANNLKQWRSHRMAMLVMLMFGAASASAHAVETITYSHLDALGSPVAATDELGNLKWREDYKPYGEKIRNEPASSSNSRAYTGHPHDNDTGLTYAGARYYDPVVGRFMAIDPKGFGEGNLQSFNRYNYANNNPYKYVDPDGRDVLIAIMRDTYTPLSITGTISVTSDRVQNSFYGVTLENTRAGDLGDKNPIQPGIYDSSVRTDHSPNRVELADSDGYTNIQIHIGNEPGDVKGCFAVGSGRSNDWVSDSANALNGVLGVIEADQRATFGQGKISTNVIGSNTEPPLIFPGLGLDM